MKLSDLPEEVQTVAATTLQTLMFEERFNTDKKPATTLAQEVKLAFIALYNDGGEAAKTENGELYYSEKTVLVCAADEALHDAKEKGSMDCFLNPVFAGAFKATNPFDITISDDEIKIITPDLKADIGEFGFISKSADVSIKIKSENYKKRYEITIKPYLSVASMEKVLIGLGMVIEKNFICVNKQMESIPSTT